MSDINVLTCTLMLVSLERRIGINENTVTTSTLIN